MSDHPSNRVTLDNVVAIFSYHQPPDDETREAHHVVRRVGEELVVAILTHCPSCADTAAAIRKVREAVMTANAAIALKPPTSSP